MLTKNKIPFIDEQKTISQGLKIINLKKLGVLVTTNKKKITTGIFTDGDVKRALQKKIDINIKKIKDYMTKNPVSVEKDTLAVKALSIMNEKKITSLCV